MELRKLEFDVVKQIYKDHLCNDFIPAEQKPLIIIQILMKMGVYHCFGLYDQEELKGYAFFCAANKKNQRAILMDYLVACNGYRGQGVGSEILTRIKKEYKEFDVILAEVERVDAGATEEDIEIRQRRKSFYLRNGFEITSLWCDLFGADLQIYAWMPEKVTEESIKVQLNEIYDTMFYEPQIRSQVVLHG